jgi:hypothetical protein
MRTLIPRALVLGFALVASAAWAGCSSEGGEEAGADEGEITQTACRIFNHQTDKPMTTAELRKLNDPLAAKALAGKNCPKGYPEAIAKMSGVGVDGKPTGIKGTDTKGCEEPKDPKEAKGAPRTGMQVFMIDELAAFKGGAEAYRTVVSRACDGRKEEDLLFSGFAGKSGVGGSVEVIGKDKTSGVFNYYETDGRGGWTFFGNSFDFIGNGYNCGPNGLCISKNSEKTSQASGKSCASCHVGGGLNMKELDTPWVHWTGGSPEGAAEAAEAQKRLLGSLGGGATLELSVVRPSMDPYSDKRVEFLATKGVEELLRPLFCTLDLNLDSSFPPQANLVTDRLLVLGSDIADVNSLHGNKGPSVGGFDMQPLYDELKEEKKQRIQDGGRAVTSKGKAVSDTAIAYTYPERSHLDMAHVLALKRAKLVDAEFISDVLHVDFTRPIFSGQRCSLLGAVAGAAKLRALNDKLADWSKAAKADKDKIAKEIAKEIPALYEAQLAAKGSRKGAEEQLLTNLKADKSAEAQTKAANDFVAACTKRMTEGTKAQKKAGLEDVMTYTSSIRRQTRAQRGLNGQQLIETDPMMVVDNIPATDLALHPETCKLTLKPDQIR